MIFNIIKRQGLYGFKFIFQNRLIRQIILIPKQNIQMDADISNNDSTISKQFIEGLWNSSTFQSKIQTFFTHTITEIQNKKLVSSSNQKLQLVDSLVEDISSNLVQSFKQNVFKQSNQLFTTNIYILQQIDKIKANIQKINGTSAGSLAKVKTQISTAEKEKHEQSLFLEQECDIEIVNLRKNAQEVEDKIGNLSFVNSFVGDGSSDDKKSQEIDQKINASISRVESTLQEKINHLQHEFTRRIEQIMKTIKHLINIMDKEHTEDKTLQNSKIDIKIKNQNKKEKQPQDKKNDSFLNKSQHKISSFFRMGN